MVLLAAFVTQVGALQTAPILIAVVTAFLAMEAVKYVVTTRRKHQPLRGWEGEHVNRRQLHVVVAGEAPRSRSGRGVDRADPAAGMRAGPASRRSDRNRV